jgi:hypothetical protein
MLMEKDSMKRFIAPLAIAAGMLVTVALVATSIVVPGHQNLFFDACVTFTVTVVGSCAYVQTREDLMAKLKAALAPVHVHRDID